MTATLTQDLRISYGGSTYKSAFTDDRHRSAAEQLEQATKNPSFLTLVDVGLSSTIFTGRCDACKCF